MMGMMNVRQSPSPLRAKYEILIWVMEYRNIFQFSDVVFATVLN